MTIDAARHFHCAQCNRAGRMPEHVPYARFLDYLDQCTHWLWVVPQIHANEIVLCPRCRADWDGGFEPFSRIVGFTGG
jgi:hypothetical protein